MQGSPRKRKDRRDMELFVRTAEQAKSLVGEKVKLLGGSYTIREADPLEKVFFLDVNGVANNYTNEAFRSVFNALKCHLLYDTYREVDETTGCSAATRRFYFALETCPRAFLVGGEPCNQFVVGDSIFSVRAKNVKFSRGPRGSARSINLTHYFEKFCPGVGNAPFSDFSVAPEPFAPVPEEGQADAPMEGQQSPHHDTDGQVEDDAPSPAPVDDDRRDGGAVTASVSCGGRDTVDCAGAGSASGSSASNSAANQSTEPSSPSDHASGSSVSTLSLPAPFVMVGAKRKPSPRSQPPAPPMELVGFASDNYFSALQETEVDVELVDLRADSGDYYQLLPTAVILPRGPPRKESCRFLRADEQRKKVLVPSEADDLSSILEAMAADVASVAAARSSLNAAAVALVDVHPSRVMMVNTNGDEILSDLLRDPLRFVAHASTAFARENEKVRQLAEMHLLNRILSATDTTAIRSFPAKWARVSSERLPANRSDLSVMLDLLRPKSPETEAQWRANVALSFFELMFMASAPTLFANDHWVQYLGGGVIHWLLTPGTRLLPINALVGVLRHSCGKTLLARWKDQGLGGPLLTTLEHIQLHDTWCTAETETRLRDRHQASRLVYHANGLDSQCFISDFNDDDSSEALPRRAGVATVIKSTFPGAQTAVVDEDRTIEGHYLVVQLHVESGPLFVHNVYAPVNDPARQQFYRTLCDQPPFVDGAIHLVLGDFNVVVDASLDSHSGSHSSASARPLLQDWLFSLGVNDAWRMHHPDERVFSGPRPRVSRLDYIFVTDSVIDSSYVKSEYFTATHGGDHLAHALWLSASKTSQGRGYWKMPRVLLQYPLVREAIVTAAQSLLERLHTASNPGVQWIEWKKTLKRDLQAVYAQIVDQDRGAVETATAALEAAMAALRDLY